MNMIREGLHELKKLGQIKITTGQLGKLFLVSAQTIRVWIEKGKLPPVLPSLGSRQMFLVDHLIEWVEKQIEK